VRIRKELRGVRAGLDQDINSLGTTLKIINIVAVPLVFAVVAVVIAMVRRRKRAEGGTPVAVAQAEKGAGA
jgi:ABC-type uncharacterized transport system involved in gliding motility auxiliary subunit